MHNYWMLLAPISHSQICCELPCRISNMLVCKLNQIFWLLLLSLQLSAILSRKENRGNNGIVMTLHHMKGEEGFVLMEAGSNHVDRAYQRLAKMVQASKDRASTLKRGMSISGEGSLYAHSNDNEFYIKLSVGTPPQDLLLVMDTGSVVIWAPCTTDYVCNNCRVFLPRKSSSAVQVKCADPKCKDLCGTGNERGRCYGSIHNCSTVSPAYQLTMAREPLPGLFPSTVFYLIINGEAN